MPEYEYEHEESGDRVTITRSMKDRIPKSVTRKGRKFTRVYGATIDAGVAAKVHGYPYRARSQPKKPWIESASAEREFAAKHNLVRD